jgi:hypothetical protein
VRRNVGRGPVDREVDLAGNGHLELQQALAAQLTKPADGGLEVLERCVHSVP